MEKISNEYTLTGGYFLYQILECMNAQSKRRGYNNCGLTQSNCFKELILLGLTDVKITGDEKTLREDTSKYKACKLEPTSWMLFLSDGYKKKFNESIQNDYENLLQKTIEWGNKYLDLDINGDWLGKAIIEMLLKDDNIVPEETELYAKKDGKVILLSELVKEQHIAIQPLILGVWNYIVNADIPNDFRDASKNVKNGLSRREIENIGKNDVYTGRIVILKPSIKRKANTSSLTDILTDAIRENAVTMSGEEVHFLIKEKEKIALSDDEFNDYLKKVYEAFIEIKTLLFRQEPRIFDTIYLPNNIKTPGIWNSSKSVTIQEPTIEKLTNWKKHIILSGTGGLGKSMMMRHLLLDSIKKYKEYKLLPIFVLLKDYKSDKYTSLFSFIYESFSSYFCELPNDKKISEDTLKEVMASGRCLFLLDGLDEIKSADKITFEQELSKMMNGYGDNVYIVSSRPFTNYISYSRFIKMELCPFTKEQSVALVHKLDLGDDEKPLKDKFESDLNNTLFDSHKEFAENPLLLTIMLMTYKNHSNIPVKMHKFYSKAYETLFTEHDAIKQGYVREYRTKLTQDRFADYVDEFCFLSYQDENFDMTEEDCKEYFNQLEAYEEDQPEFTWKDFMHDLTDAVCLMYKEGQKYHFLHRSIQEYFCARYFYRQEESNLWEIAMFFEEMRVRDTDKTFPMLYDMKQRAVEEKIFIPLLSQFFDTEVPITNDQELINLVYPKFVQKIYPFILFDDGEVPGDAVTEPSSYIYKFMAKRINQFPDVCALEAEWEEIFDTIDEYVYYDPNYSEEVEEDGYIRYEKGLHERLVSIDEVSSEYKEYIEDPEPVGYTYQLNTKELYEKEDEYPWIIECIEMEDFPIMQEFLGMYQYYQKITHSKKVHKTDLRNKLRRKNIKEFYISNSLEPNDVKNFESNKGNSIKLNEMLNPWKTIDANCGRVFELKTSFEFKSMYQEPGERSILVSSEVHGVHLEGVTSADNWPSKSYMNNLLRAGKYECTAWFTVINRDDKECYVQFLIIGGEIIW